MFLTRDEIEAEVPGLYEVIPPQFRDRMPRGAMARAQNTEILTHGFAFLTSFVEKTFARLHYTKGQDWPFFKLVGAFYLVEQEVGTEAVRRVGTEIFRRMPWPPDVHDGFDAIRGIEGAYRASHYNTTFETAGGWPVHVDEPGRIVIENATPYPCFLEEGTIAGVCDAFPGDRLRYRLLADRGSKRDGATSTFYEVTVDPRPTLRPKT